jgi:hypothetical protein
MNFWVMNDIDVHQLILIQFKNLKILVENPLKKCVFLHFLNNRCIINSYVLEETITLRKRKRFYRWALYCFFIFLWFGNVS